MWSKKLSTIQNNLKKQAESIQGLTLLEIQEIEDKEAALGFYKQNLPVKEKKICRAESPLDKLLIKSIENGNNR